MLKFSYIFLSILKPKGW